MCRSRCVLRVNVAGHIEQDFGRGGSVGVDVDVDGLLGPADMSFSKIPGIIIFLWCCVVWRRRGEEFHGTRYDGAAIYCIGLPQNKKR